MGVGVQACLSVRGVLKLEKGWDMYCIIGNIVMEVLPFVMVINILVNMEMVREMGKEHLFGLMDENILVNGEMEECMAWEK
jgi:hypothetical protein